MEWSHEFLAKIGRGEVANQEMSVDRATARYNGVRTKDISEAVVIPNLMKYITIAFNYLGQTADPSMLKLIVNDILNAYGWMSPLEIAKAINEGRQHPGELYGKLSGKHVMDWLHEYDVRMQHDIARYKQNQKHQQDVELDKILEGALLSQAKEPRREYTHIEKVDDLNARYRTLTDEEQARQKHLWAWRFEDHGDLKAYVEAYDESIKNQKDKANEPE